MPNETKCPKNDGWDWKMNWCRENRISPADSDNWNSATVAYLGHTIQALKKENKAQKSTIRNIFDDLEFGYDNSMIQAKMKNGSYNTDKWGNPTTEES